MNPKQETLVKDTQPMATRSPSAQLQAQKAFPSGRPSPLRPPKNPGGPRSKPRGTWLLTLPDSKRDQDRLLGAGGLGGKEQRKKPGPSRPSYLGSLNGFQIKTGGCPGPTPGGAVFQETCGSRQVQGQAQRLPQLVASFTVPAQANSAASGRGPEATASLQGRPREPG